MTKINAGVFSGLTGADTNLIARAVELINDQRLTTLDSLREGLSKDAWTVRVATPDDKEKMKDNPAIYINSDTLEGKKIKGQIVLQPEDLLSSSDAGVLKFIDNLRHEAEHGQSSKEERRIDASYALLRAHDGLSATERGDKYVKAILDDETQARYEAWQFRVQLLSLDTTYAFSNRVYLGTEKIYKEFARLDGIANELGLKGEGKKAYILEEGRGVMAAYENHKYPKASANYVIEVFQSQNTPLGPDYVDHVKQSFNVVGFEVTEVVGHDDGSSSGSVTYEDGRRVEVIFDASGRLFQEVETAANGDKTTTQYFTDGKVSRVVEADGANDNADYASRTTVYDAEGRTDVSDILLDDGARHLTDIDQAGSQPWSRTETHVDALGRVDDVAVVMDDGSRDWFDHDPANIRGDSLWQNRTDAQGREDWRKVTGDDGSVEWTDFDQTNLRGDHIWSNRTDAQGREDWRRVTLDDGGVEWTDFDQANARGDQIWSSRTDAQGLEDWRRITGDDGGVEWIDFDQANARGDSIWSNHTDAQGREDWRRVTGDDGGVEWTDFDQANARGDQIWSNRTDAQGLEDWRRITGDDGSVEWIDYDQANARGDSIWSNYTDAEGREDWCRITGDDGGVAWYDYDQANTRVDRLWSNRTDAQGREDWTSITYDSGVRDWYDYDLDNSQAWRQMEARFDSWGREEYSVVFMDDGGRRYHYADNQGLLPWSRREYAYDADLELRYALELRDDGTWHPIT